MQILLEVLLLLVFLYPSETGIPSCMSMGERLYCKLGKSGSFCELNTQTFRALEVGDSTLVTLDVACLNRTFPFLTVSDKFQ